MRLAFPTQAEAQIYADRVHNWMRTNDAAYNRSVRAGQTTAWARPYRDLDKDGVPLNSTWWINLKPRSRNAATEPEQDALQPYRR